VDGMDMRMADAPRTALRELRDIVYAATPTHGLLRNRILVIAMITTVVDAIGSVLVYMFEHNAKGTEISTIGDSLFWVSCQLLTVSSQISNPFTTGGRIVDVFLELYAITVVTTLAGSWGAFFHRRGMERHPIAHPPGDM
jgi:hypothetical protein